MERDKLPVLVLFPGTDPDIAINCDITCLLSHARLLTVPRCPVHGLLDGRTETKNHPNTALYELYLSDKRSCTVIAVHFMVSVLRTLPFIRDFFERHRELISLFGQFRLRKRHFLAVYGEQKTHCNIEAHILLSVHGQKGKAAICDPKISGIRQPVQEAGKEKDEQAAKTNQNAKPVRHPLEPRKKQDSHCQREQK